MSGGPSLLAYRAVQHRSVRAYLASLILLLALAACGLGDGASHGGCHCAISNGVVAIEFGSAVSYERALREVTDAGYQPTVQCGFAADGAAGRIIEGLRWQPAGQRDRFSHTHIVFVVGTPLAPTGADQFSILNTLQGVTRSTWQETIQCANPDARPSDVTPPAGTPTVFTPSELKSVPYARVTFASSTDYDTALAAISNLGVRLGDYCYETGFEAFNHGKTPWHPMGMGQESSFASTYTLTVAPSPLTTAHTWLDQLSALPGVTAVQANYIPSC